MNHLQVKAVRMSARVAKKADISCGLAQFGWFVYDESGAFNEKVI